MTISYTLDVSQANWKSLLNLFMRWRGSLWKAVLLQLVLWTFMYLCVSATYRYLLNEKHQLIFEALAKYINTGLDAHIPLTFMLGFFVSFVIGRWSSILNGLGWIDSAAMCFATFIRGNEEETRILRRTLIRYMVLNQTLVLRDISMQVRKRFPTLETLVAAGILTNSELTELINVKDLYSRYWIPLHWCYSLIYDARLHGKILSDHILEHITHEIHTFRNGLASLLKYDWVPIPLLYPQVIFFSVRLYFILCLIGRQFIIKQLSTEKVDIDLIFPIVTMIQFVVYVGWMKVAEDLLNPLGEDDDDLECNHVIDKNLITGMTLVEQGGKSCPSLTKDMFWDNDHIAPLYSLNAANRTVHPLIGSASQINLVDDNKGITMLPHKSKLCYMDEDTQKSYIHLINVDEHNELFKSFEQKQNEVNPDNVLRQIWRKKNKGLLHSHSINLNRRSLPKFTAENKIGDQPSNFMKPPSNNYGLFELLQALNSFY